MNPRSHTLLVLIGLVVVTTACGMPDSAPQVNLAAQDSAEPKKTETTEIEADKTKAVIGFECPVTIPTQPGFTATKSKDVTYTEHFPAPDPWPAEYPHEGMVWYGSEELWTVLDVDGDHGGRKSVWWSVNFPGGTVEARPEVSVTWTRLDTGKPVVVDNEGIATNAHTSTEGWFMIAGIDPPQAGCWEVEATYEGATLSYVYKK